MASILLLNGPNLNLLGVREPGVYGDRGLIAFEQDLQMLAMGLGHELRCFQSNAEHELIDAIHQARLDQVKAIIINPGAFTHTSVAIRDALSGVAIPFYEVHLSNVHVRESFRHHSYLSDIAAGVICGLGPKGYEIALHAASEQIQS
jgi:3-dehydroquinate dehydratase-2